MSPRQPAVVPALCYSSFSSETVYTDDPDAQTEEDVAAAAMFVAYLDSLTKHLSRDPDDVVLKMIFEFELSLT